MERVEIAKGLRDILVDSFGVKEDSITPATKLSTHLGLDSLQIIDCANIVEGRFNIQLPNCGLERTETFEDAVNYLYSQINGGK